MTPKLTRVLITNDDGIDSPGLHALAASLSGTGFEVIVAAPAVQYSGASASILGAEEDGTIRFERRDLEQLPGITAYAVQAAPALISWSPPTVPSGHRPTWCSRASTGARTSAARSCTPARSAQR